MPTSLISPHLATTTGAAEKPQQVAAATTDAPAQSAATPTPARDTADISEEGKALAAKGKAPSGIPLSSGSTDESEESEGTTAIDQMIKDLQKKIQKLQQEIRELRGKDMDPRLKQKMIAMKQAELTALQDQLNKAMEEKIKIENADTGSVGVSFMTKGSLV